ncbi:uncharacterized protein [Trachinotus anak]|uniref:uncharacterized protein isoform X2 n=1 Tax=Trachinotus anak TaxID=443729 RepID=UPI0039F23D7C
MMSSDDDETDIYTPPAFGTSKPKMMKAAKERVLSQLKSSLMNKRPRTSTPSQSEEDDVDIDTNMDLFDSPQASGTADPCFRQQGMESGQMNQALENIDRHQDVMDALKEIPTLVKCVKELTTTMQRLLPSFDSDTSSGSSSPAPEMIQ